MSNEVLQLLVVVMAVVVVCQLALGVWYIARARRYRERALAEKIRLQIGDARCRLVNAVARGELSPTTVTFQQLYLAQTYLMRSTKQYPALSEAMWARLLKFEKRTKPAFTKEAKHWTPEIREVVMQTADAIHQIWLRCMPFGVIIRLGRHTLVALRLVSYHALEVFSDRMLARLVALADRIDSALARLTVRLPAKPSVGTEVRLVHDMRQSERLLRKALARAA